MMIYGQPNVTCLTIDMYNVHRTKLITEDLLIILAFDIFRCMCECVECHIATTAFPFSLTNFEPNEHWRTLSISTMTRCQREGRGE